MHLIAGLGNPGPKYDSTAHNLGFMTLDRLASEEGVAFSWREANCLMGRGRAGGEEVLLAKPLSYMNLSGPPLKALLDRYELPPSRLLVVHDELALPWGVLRVRERGSSAGHRGVESIISALGTQEFARVRLGVRPDHPVEDGAAYVLKRLSRAQSRSLEDFLGRAVEAVRLILSDGAAKAMTVCNRRAEG